jgi:transposase
MLRTRRRFTAEFKVEAVKLLEESGRPLQGGRRGARGARQPAQGLAERALAAGSAEALARQKAEAAELARLRREVSRRTRSSERAAAFFAREAVPS